MVQGRGFGAANTISALVRRKEIARRGTAGMVPIRHWVSLREMLKKLRSALPLGLAFCLAALTAAAQTPPPEGVKVRELGPIQPHWVFLNCPAGADSEQATKIVAVDGDSLQVLGMLTGGVLGTAAISPDHRFIYAADTFYSRGARGERADVVTTYDARRLAPVREVIIPPKRQQTIPPDSSALTLTSDGRLLLVANLTPATSMTVVDLANNKMLGEIETPGCTGILMSGARRFESLCGDGAMLSVDFDDSGKLTGSKRMAKPFFDPEKDPVFSVPAVLGNTAYFISYHATVYPVDWSVEPPKAEAPWPMLTDEQRRQGWRPGGYQPLAGYAPGNLFYVLMHRGGEWSHKQAGTEVWVYSATHKQRVDRIVLPRPGTDLYVTRDNDPRLFVVSLPDLQGPPSAPALQSFSARTGRYLGALDQLPGFPLWMFGAP
jgi:methylamine dehydrogenase heavy chain